MINEFLRFQEQEASLSIKSTDKSFERELVRLLIAQNKVDQAFEILKSEVFKSKLFSKFQFYLISIKY